MKRSERALLSKRAFFVGCQFCGETDQPLRNFEGEKICPECLKKKRVPELGTKEEKK